MSSTYDDDTAVIEGFCYLAYAIAIFLTFFVIYNTAWSDVEKREIEYKQIGWRQVHGIVDKVDGRSGTIKPDTERVIVTYTYNNSEVPIKTNLDVGIGYQPGDAVTFFANKDGETQIVNSRFVGTEGYDPTVYSTTSEYLVVVFYAIILWIILGFFIWFILLMMAAAIMSIWEKSKTKSRTTQPAR